MPRPKTKRKRLKRAALAVLIVLLISAPVFIGVAWYGLSNKPIVDYTFGGAGDFRVHYRLTLSTQKLLGTIDVAQVLIRNRGTTNISVIVTMHAVNAVVSTSYYGPYSEIASEQSLAVVGVGYRAVTFYLSLISRVSSFEIWCDVSGVVDYSTFSSLLATTFSEINPISPIHLLYIQDSSNPNEYHLAQPP